jgi:intein-encoded DNA endonuclease-like protein
MIKSHNITVRKRKNTLDEHCFDVIDTEEKAYWLGFMYADGYVSSDLKEFSLSLQERDIDHLNVFKGFVGSNAKLLRLDYTVKNPSISYKLFIGSRVVAESLNKLGCTPNKSLTLKFPSKEIVPEHLTQHFIRGYFDGDGCVYIDKQNILFQAVGTKDMMEHIVKTVGVDMNVRQIGNVYEIRCKGNAKAMKVFDWMYKDASVCLRRKYDKYINHKNYILCRSERKHSE